MLGTYFDAGLQFAIVGLGQLVQRLRQKAFDTKKPGYGVSVAWIPQIST
jgi:hypothetical protein